MKEIESRRSTPVLVDPAPSDEQVKKLLRSAQLAPDHGRLKPWQFIVVKGEARHALGELYLQAALADKADLSDERKERVRKMPLRAPLVIVAATKVVENHKVPVLEQALATGAAVQNMLLSAESLNYGTMWRTGDMAYSDVVKEGLGLRSEDVIVAFLYIGSIGAEPKARPELDYSACCVEWNG